MTAEPRPAQKPAADVPVEQKHPPEAVEPGVEPLEPRSTRTSATRQRIRRRTGSGDHALDEKIAALVRESPYPIADDDLLTQSIETLFRMAKTANRGDTRRKMSAACSGVV